jgi:hypothetical protein
MKMIGHVVDGNVVRLRFGPSGQGYALIDLEDAAEVLKFKWRLSSHQASLRVVQSQPPHTGLAQFVMQLSGKSYGTRVRFRNSNSVDCRKENLI